MGVPDCMPNRKVCTCIGDAQAKTFYVDLCVVDTLSATTAPNRKGPVAQLDRARDF